MTWLCSFFARCSRKKKSHAPSLQEGGRLTLQWGVFVVANAAQIDDALESPQQQLREQFTKQIQQADDFYVQRVWNTVCHLGNGLSGNEPFTVFDGFTAETWFQATWEKNMAKVPPHLRQLETTCTIIGAMSCLDLLCPPANEGAIPDKEYDIIIKRYHINYSAHLGNTRPELQTISPDHLAQAFVKIRELARTHAALAKLYSPEVAPEVPSAHTNVIQSINPCRS